MTDHIEVLRGLVAKMRAVEVSDEPPSEFDKGYEQAREECASELDAALAAMAAQPDKRDREADRERFPDPYFNNWLDEVISDAGHTVWCAVGDLADAWRGWEARQYYAPQQPCPCGLATCQEPWEPGCGLGNSEAHAVVAPQQPEAQAGGEVVGNSGSVKQKLPARKRYPKPDENGNDTGPCCAHAYADGWNECLDAIKDTTPPPGAVPEGWKLVPVDEFVLAAPVREAVEEWRGCRSPLEAQRAMFKIEAAIGPGAMLAAAPGAKGGA